MMTNKPLEHYMKKLPNSIEKHIISFLIPSSEEIIFVNHQKKNRDQYSMKYQEAFINSNLVENNDKYYLSRIIKKNNKHRYYKSLQILDTVEREYNGREIILEAFEYQSKYIGKDIDIALLILLFNL
jgi:hypothetical protein